MNRNPISWTQLMGFFMKYNLMLKQSVIAYYTQLINGFIRRSIKYHNWHSGTGLNE